MSKDRGERAQREGDPQARKIAAHTILNALWKLYLHLKSIGKSTAGVLRRIREVSSGQLRRSGPDQDGH